MSFPPDVKEQALVASARSCSICHKFVGIKIELHHIIQRSEGGQDSFDNCIPLCFDCHGDMRSYDHKHPKGTKYTVGELKAHRDAWYARVATSSPISSTTEHLELDKALYKKITTILPWDGSVKFAREFNFSGWLYESNRIDNFNEFIYQCGDPSFTFIDEKMEEFRYELATAIRSFLDVEASETFLTNNPGYRSVPEEWEFQQPQRFREAVAKLEGLGDQIGTTYDTLIRTGRHRLGI